MIAVFADSLLAWSTAVLAGVGLVALGGTAVTIYQARNEARRTRTYEYMRRLYNADFLPRVTRTRTFLRSAHVGAAKMHCWQRKEPLELARSRLKKMNALQQDEIALVLNFFEEMSGMYLLNLLDEGIADNMLVPFAIVLWKEADWYVKDRRADITRAEGPEAAARLLDHWGALVQSKT